MLILILIWGNYQKNPESETVYKTTGLIHSKMSLLLKKTKGRREGRKRQGKMKMLF